MRRWSPIVALIVLFVTGTSIEGGTSRKLAKGDWVMVPEKTPHWFTQVEGALVLMSIHLPRE
jgi:quercetin dioxygenase-like cupin family protein